MDEISLSISDTNFMCSVSKSNIYTTANITNTKLKQILLCRIFTFPIDWRGFLVFFLGENI